MFNQNSAGGTLQSICPKSWRFKTNAALDEAKIPIKPALNRTSKEPDGTGIASRCSQDTCTMPQTASEHVVCIRMQATFSPPLGLVHTVAQTWLSYWPTTHWYRRDDSLQRPSGHTHLIYMPWFRWLLFEFSNLQKQPCWQENNKPQAQQRDIWVPGSVRSKCAQQYSLIKSNTSGPCLEELSGLKY